MTFINNEQLLINMRYEWTAVTSWRLISLHQPISLQPCSSILPTLTGEVPPLISQEPSLIMNRAGGNSGWSWPRQMIDVCLTHGALLKWGYPQKCLACCRAWFINWMIIGSIPGTWETVTCCQWVLMGNHGHTMVHYKTGLYDELNKSRVPADHRLTGHFFIHNSHSLSLIHS